ncbi:unnamed protein product [Brassica napus]|uniref:(rape) hypothetical protein n=1 Tax=Brassica napus TaxID=3708 RepID=A0A816ZPS6_BRANA|nr:unnamed protein product [Brassica napus]
MLLKRQMLQTLIQERLTWKKCYKTWRFKYKARLKQVQVRLLQVVLSHWRSSGFVWHRWRSKERGRRIERDMLKSIKAYRLAVLSSQRSYMLSTKRMVGYFHTSLWASLFSKEEVLIDIKYVYMDLARAELTWLRGKDMAKLRTAPEGLLLETYEAARDKAMSIRGEDDEERRML